MPEPEDNDKASQIVAMVYAGQADTQLAELQQAIKQRRNVVAMTALRAGKPFRMNDTARPRYLIGATGVIRTVNQTRAVCDFDPGQHLERFSDRSGVHVPFSMLEPVDS